MFVRNNYNTGYVPLSTYPSFLAILLLWFFALISCIPIMFWHHTEDVPTTPEDIRLYLQYHFGLIKSVSNVRKKKKLCVSRSN